MELFGFFDVVRNFLTPLFTPSSLLSFGGAAVLIWFAIKWPGIWGKVIAASAAAALLAYGVGYIRGDHEGSGRILAQWDEANDRIAAAQVERDKEIAALAAKNAKAALDLIASISQQQTTVITDYAASIATPTRAQCALTRSQLDGMRKARDAWLKRRNSR